MSKRALIIDCDPGVDDAVALLLAFASRDRLDLLGITTVAGNVGLEQTARNARIIREIAGCEDVPVFAGCPGPMAREPVEAGDVHGETGLGPLSIFEPDAAAEPEHAVRFIVDTLKAAEAPVTLAVLGPATNVAMALAMEPAIAAKIEEIVVMGGARAAGGNVTASAEFNVFADPHATHILLRAGRPVTMIGLDATYQALSTPDRIIALEAMGSRAARTAAELMWFSNGLETEPERRGGAPLHDPCVIAWLLRPDLFKTRPARVGVELSGGLTFGATSIEFRIEPEEANAAWAVEVDGDGVFELLAERLGGR